MDVERYVATRSQRERIGIKISLDEAQALLGIMNAVDAPSITTFHVFRKLLQEAVSHEPRRGD